jgi:hypothetical protein
VQKTTDTLKAEGFGMLSQVDLQATLTQKLEVDIRLDSDLYSIASSPHRKIAYPKYIGYFAYIEVG